MKPLAPNSMIQNRYLIVQLVGKGGMGEVYLAVDQRLGSAVALKRTYFADDEMLGNAFEREAKILARLRHPVLPKVSDHFAENGEQYLVMEHISGDDLSKRLEAAQKPFPTSWVLFWADQLLDALSYLHSHEPPIIHRDIKPQNLKLTDENHIILLDFGLSKNSTGTTNVTSTSGSSSGSIVGYTPHYAPMEQIRGTGTSPRSDLYGLSATLYQLITNAVPADALTRADALINGMADPIRAINELNPEISHDVSNVILKGMEVSQEKRYQDARQMQKALRKAYSSMQEAMTAHTVAFNSQEAFAPGPHDSYGKSVAPSESLDRASSLASEGPTKTPSKGTPSFPPPGSSGAASGGSNQNYDATVGYDSGAGEQPLRQADVKTEVYRAGDSPLNTAGYGVPAEQSSFGHTPPVTENYGSSSDANTGGNFSPDATVPLISLEGAEGGYSTGSEAGSPEFFTTPNVSNPAADQFSTVTPGQFEQARGDAREEPENKPQAAVQATPRPAKAKSSKKVIFVFAGLLALFFLGIVGAGAGWFVYNNYYAVAEPTPSPSPEPSLEISPTPEPTLEALIDSNTNTNTQTNSNTGFGSNSNTSNLTVAPTPVPTSEPTQERVVTQRPTPQPTVRVTTTRTPGTRPTPVSKPTPRPRPTILN